jgi:hypothetical protein
VALEVNYNYIFCDKVKKIEDFLFPELGFIGHVKNKLFTEEYLQLQKEQLKLKR